MATVKAFRLYKDSQGQWRWRLLAANGKVIADSGEGYNNRADAIHGARLVAGVAEGAGIYDDTIGGWVP